MAYKNKVLSTSGCLQLIESIPSKGKKRYIIKLSDNRHRFYSYELCKKIENILDPMGNRALAGGGYRWRFNSRTEAQELLTIVVLSGLSRRP